MARTIAAALCTLVVGAVAPLAPTVPASGLAPPRAALVAADPDGDGHVEPADCGPLDPTVHPDAPDRPDLDFMDSNCDGIDGDAASAVFVSLGGNDAATGSAANPFRTVGKAVSVAGAAGKDVYVAGGTYAESVALADEVGIYGGYTPGSWMRSESEPTTIQGAPAALAEGDTGVVLQSLTLRGTRDGAGNSYGMRAVPGGGHASQVALERVDLTASDAGPGAGGSAGASGLSGTGGLGGAGGAGGCGAGVPGQPGAFGTGSGAPGASGAPGPHGVFVVPSGPTWVHPAAGPGGQGGSGLGGRGGTGGLGNSYLSAICGGRGGAGGPGGGGGYGGSGGQAGGGSFGAYVFDSSLVALGSTIGSGNGGAGGAGGAGGGGGAGLPGMAGLPGECQSLFTTVCAQPGAQGAAGAVGGQGGRGGGGAGGPSAAVYQGGPTSGFTNHASTLTAGQGGAGGAGGAGSGQQGAAQPVLRTGTAPTTSTYDFDGDGVDDPVDDCPADPAGPSGRAGCPTGPETTITSGPADGGFLLADRASLGLGSSAASPTFTCSLDGWDGTDCTSPHDLTRLAGGTHVFRVWSRDGGAADPTAATRAFTVPRNNTALSASRGWTRKTGSGYFLNSVSTATKKGSSLSTRVVDAQQLALVATRGRGFGKVDVMLGRTRLARIDLASTRTRKKQLVPVPVTGPLSGTVRLVVATSGKPVSIEGLGVATP